MKRAKFYYVCLGLILATFVLSHKTAAQQYEIGFGLGGSTYTGDMIRRIDPSQSGLQGTLFGRRNFDNVWSLRGGLAIGRLNATDSIRPIDPMALERNAAFRGTLVETHLMMEYYFLDFLNPQSTVRFSPFAMFGFGFAFFMGKEDQLGFNNTNYYVGTPVIPFGLGVKYQLKDRLFMTLEFGARATFTDYLDRIEHNPEYFQPRAVPIGGGEYITNPNTYTFGDRDNKDWYYFLGVTVSYSFHQVKCFNFN
ncbi:outer membrane beta-barrel protein [Litoribacter alkaliphilus]|uniref:Outer membrane beta-barrel protein n=1 Tax=Litoribacter ruber TaxID=702568 RepID=A0AAP2G4R8_9BACT|nr:DUF6089 family protein [Litoribacter alkaliphilus]MBS9524316.1 outer membrane beta-barrel protein [Litoribacter alkaliphilus]